MILERLRFYHHGKFLYKILAYFYGGKQSIKTVKPWDFKYLEEFRLLGGHCYVERKTGHLVIGCIENLLLIILRELNSGAKIRGHCNEKNLIC